MSRIQELKSLESHLIWKIVWNLTGLTWKDESFLLTLPALESIVLGSSNLLTL